MLQISPSLFAITNYEPFPFYIISGMKSSWSHIIITLFIFLADIISILVTVETNIIFTADIISCVEFNQDGELLATGDKGGRVVIFQVINPF